MPYNNTPIAPSKEVTGHVSLPLARVQKIIHADPERLNVSKNAAFAIALATEMFIQHLATTTHNVVKTERKPRRNIQYRDVSSAIAKTDNLEFAVDVVPKTVVFKEAKKRKEEREAREKEVEERRDKEKDKGKEKATSNGNGNGNGNGNTHTHESPTEQINGAPPIPNGTSSSSSLPVPNEPALPNADDAMDLDERVGDSDKEDEQDAAAMQLEMEMRGPPGQAVAQAQRSPEARRSTGGFTSINGAN